MNYYPRKIFTGWEAANYLKLNSQFKSHVGPRYGIVEIGDFSGIKVFQVDEVIDSDVLYVDSIDKTLYKIKILNLMR